MIKFSYHSTFSSFTSRRFSLSYLRNERRRPDPEIARIYDSIPALVGEFRAKTPELRTDSEVMAWRALAVHADIVTMTSLLFARLARGIPHEDIVEAIRTYVQQTEMSVQSRFDGSCFVKELINRFSRR